MLKQILRPMTFGWLLMKMNERKILSKWSWKIGMSGWKENMIREWVWEWSTREMILIFYEAYKNTDSKIIIFISLESFAKLTKNLNKLLYELCICCKL